jgi:hypothetical protein
MSHVAGARGDQLFVYGGFTASGATTELWAFNLISQSWAMVTPSSPAPGAATDLGYGVGAFLGRHLYHYAQAANSNGPIPGAGQLWRWAPAASSGAAPAPEASSSANMAIINGHTAGIAITVLLCTAILAVSVLSAQQLGALPLGLGDCCGASRKSVPSGFYVTSNSPNRAAAAVNGGYVAPPDTI